jgi:hypothetical protein
MSDGSVWEALRKQKNEIASDREPLYLDSPVYDGVVFRYRYVPIEETKAMGRRLAKIRDITDQAVASAIETILLSIDEIMVQARDGEIPTGRGGVSLYSAPLKRLADEGEPPIKFDERLCAGMEFSEKVAEHARSIVREMFGRNSYLILEHAREISEWAASTGETVRDELKGEIEGGLSVERGSTPPHSTISPDMTGERFSGVQ